MKKIFLLFIIISLMIIQCGNKKTSDSKISGTYDTDKASEVIPESKILSQEDIRFLEKVKNKIVINGNFKYIFKDNGDIEYLYNFGDYRENKNYIFESSKDGTNSYYYELYNIQDRYEKGPSNIAANYRGFSVKNGILYEDNYRGYEGDPNETIITKWERENYYSNYYYGEVKENPNFDNFPYENKADVSFNKYNEIQKGILISQSDYKPEEIGDIQNYDFDGKYTDLYNSSVELKKNDDGYFYLYAINKLKDENGRIITNIQSTDTNKMILEENEYIDPICGIEDYNLYYEKASGMDLGYTMYIQPINADTIIITEPNGSYGFTGIYKKVYEIAADDKSTKEKAYYNALRWYVENYTEINEAFNKIADFDFEGGGYYKFNMENAYIYMSKFENSGYFSENYIKSLEDRIETVKNDLEKNKQNDGVVEGMDADWFLRTQEIDYILDMIDKMELKDIKSYTNDRNEEYCEYYGISLQLKKYGDEWLIEFLP